MDLHVVLGQINFEIFFQISHCSWNVGGGG